MTLKPFLWTLCLIASTIFLLPYGCKKNPGLTTAVDSIPSPAPSKPNPSPAVEFVTATITGRVIDIDKMPVSGATITAGSGKTTTDINGQFLFNNLQIDKNAAYVLAEKDGYFNGSRTIELSPGSSQHVEIQLITKSQSGQFSTSSGGTISISQGGTISFTANSIVDPATNSSYSGTVTVSAYYFDPSKPEFLDIIPGNLAGIAKDSSVKCLQSYGMMVAELNGNSGQKLQIAPGRSALLTLPVPASLKSSAPAKIPLWYFDEIKGMWRESDSASLQGDNYVAQVSHFSFWNCDGPYGIVNLQFLVEDSSSNPLSSVKVEIGASSNNSILFRSGYTGANGMLQARVPANTDLIINIYDRCDNLIHSQNLSTTNADVDLGTIHANINNIPVSFSGTVIDCSETPVANGLVKILIDGFYTDVPVINGNFSVTISRCSTTPTAAQLLAGDLNTNLVDSSTINNVTSGTIPPVRFRACNQSPEFIYYTLKGVSDTFSLANSNFVDNQGNSSWMPFGVAAIDNNNPNKFFRIVYGDSSALNTVQKGVLIWLTNYDSTWGSNSLTLTELGGVNTGYVGGTFTGLVYDWMNGGVNVPITGQFRVKRTR